MTSFLLRAAFAAAALLAGTAPAHAAQRAGGSIGNVVSEPARTAPAAAPASAPQRADVKPAPASQPRR